MRMATAAMTGPTEDISPPAPMDHPTSPMGTAMVPIQDSHSPSSPPVSHRHHMGHSDPSIYRAAHSHLGAYGPPPGYPGYSPYGAPPHSPYGAPTHGFPPGAYPAPHSSPSYGYGYPPGARPPYHYASYESFQGQQQPRQAPPYRGVPGAHPGESAPPLRPPTQQSRHGTPQKPGSPPGKASPTRSPDASLRAPKVADRVEVERLRAAAATELTHDEVKPIQTDFHFFVKGKVEEFRKLAEEEIRKTQKEGDELDPFLLNSNLNTRLTKAWEDLKREERDAFMVQEEDDRRRFMAEDEIASRHCATLTARGKSPRSAEKDKTKIEERQESDTKLPATPDRESPSKKEFKQANSIDEEQKSGERIKVEESETVQAEPAKKRSSPPAVVTEEVRESPTKRNRLAEEAAA